MSGFDTRIPTHHEFNTCAHIVLTNNSIWDPTDLDLYQQEKNYENNDPEDLGPMSLRGWRNLFPMHHRTKVSYVLISVSNTLQADSFLEIIDDTMKVHLTWKNVAEMYTTYKKCFARKTIRNWPGNGSKDNNIHKA